MVGHTLIGGSLNILYSKRETERERERERERSIKT
jgi:hypothetical protein